MKKILKVILVIFLGISLCACEQKVEVKEEAKKEEIEGLETLNGKITKTEIKCEKVKEIKDLVAGMILAKDGKLYNVDTCEMFEPNHTFIKAIGSNQLLDVNNQFYSLIKEEGKYLTLYKENIGPDSYDYFHIDRNDYKDVFVISKVHQSDDVFLVKENKIYKYRYDNLQPELILSLKAGEVIEYITSNMTIKTNQTIYKYEIEKSDSENHGFEEVEQILKDQFDKIVFYDQCDNYWINLIDNNNTLYEIYFRE